jgi:hypothetical protein
MSSSAKPEIGYFVQYPPFLRDGVGEHDIEGREAIGRDDQHRFRVYRIDIADLTLMDPFEAA